MHDENSSEFLFWYIIMSHFVFSQVAGATLLEENAHIQREEELATIHNPPPPFQPSLLLPPTGTEKSVRDSERERGKQEDNVPNSASFLIPLHPSCDGHSPGHRSPRVTAHLILFLCLCVTCQMVSEVVQLQTSTIQIGQMTFKHLSSAPAAYTIRCTQAQEEGHLVIFP